MKRPDKDEERESRIQDEIIVDAYGPEEQAAGWHIYLSDTLETPFSARCMRRHTTSPLEPGEEVKVTAMAPEKVCEHDMLVMIQWNGRHFAVPLVQLQGIRVGEETRQAIEDWQYWVNRGHTL